MLAGIRNICILMWKLSRFMMILFIIDKKRYSFGFDDTIFYDPFLFYVKWYMLSTTSNLYDQIWCLCHEQFVFRTSSYRSSCRSFTVLIALLHQMKHFYWFWALSIYQYNMFFRSLCHFSSSLSASIDYFHHPIPLLPFCWY